MYSVVLYLIKVVICSGIFFLYYLLALRNKNFHPYNRFYLLVTSAFSCMLPLLHVSMFDVQSNNEKMLQLMRLMYGGTLPDVTVGAEQPHLLTPKTALIFACIAVTVILLALIAVRIVKIYRLKRSFPLTKIEDVDFVYTDIDNAPFSFMRNLFWRNDIELDDETGMQILQHEMAHIRQRHSLDKVYFQLLRAVFWINPVFYFMEKELLLIHEFIADQNAVKDRDGEAFARMLLMTQIGKFAFEPAHPFFYSTIKKRLMMITNSRKPKYSYLRRLMVLPLLGCVTLAFAFRAHRVAVEKQNKAVDNMISVLQQDSVRNAIGKTVTPGDTVHLRLVTGYGETIHVKKGDTVFFKKDTTYSFEPVKKTAAIFVPAGEPLYVIDGVPSTREREETITRDEIESINVIKDKAAEAIYGDAAKNGVVIITTKKKQLSQLRKDSLRKLQGNKIIVHPADDNKPKVVIGLPAGLQHPLIFINGKKSSSGELNNISPDAIKKINVIKDVSNQYGDEGKNDIIEITTKDTLPQVVVVGLGAKDRAQNFTGTFSSVQEEPSFPGGVNAWSTYLKKNLKENVPVDNNAPPGQYAITVSFLVDKDGDVSEVKAIKAPNPDYGTAAEAERVIWRSGKWIPAHQNGRAVTYRQKQKIVFSVQAD